MDKRTQACLIWILILGLILGIGVTAYPLVSAWYSRQVQSGIQTDYAQIIREAEGSSIQEEKAAARRYNRQFFLGSIDPLTPAENGYYDFLNPAGNGIMGYVHIPKIGVNLLIYHGIGDDALSRGAGHLPQSSLPIGGENTHSVISAHSGMASSPMFSDLPLMEIGDVFSLEVLGEVLYYEVDQIRTVLPVDIESIRVESGKDLCTLVTCTPYGINSHRLLVRGHRVEGEAVTAEEERVVEVDPEPASDSLWLSHYIRRVGIGGILGAVVFLGVLGISALWRKRHG